MKHKDCEYFIHKDEKYAFQKSFPNQSVCIENISVIKGVEPEEGACDKFKKKEIN